MSWFAHKMLLHSSAKCFLLYTKLFQTWFAVIVIDMDDNRKQKEYLNVKGPILCVTICVVTSIPQAGEDWYCICKGGHG